MFMRIPSRVLVQMKLIAILALLMILVPTSAVTDEKHDQADGVQPMPETGEKCGQCPCVNPCSQQQLPPPPPPPPAMTTQYCPPPPPRFYYFSGPAEQTQTTTPGAGPPPPRFNYVTGTPGNSNLYPTDPFNLEISNGAISYQCNILLGSLMVICGLLQIWVFYTA